MMESAQYLHLPFAFAKLDPVPLVFSLFECDASVFVIFFYGRHNIILVCVLK